VIEIPRIGSDSHCPPYCAQTNFQFSGQIKVAAIIPVMIVCAVSSIGVRGRGDLVRLLTDESWPPCFLLAGVGRVGRRASRPLSLALSRKPSVRPFGDRDQFHTRREGFFRSHFAGQEKADHGPIQNSGNRPVFASSNRMPSRPL